MPSKEPKRDFKVGDKIRVNLRHGRIDDAVVKAVIRPRGSVQKRPTGVISKPANGSGPELLEVVLDHELSKQGKSALFP